MMTEWHPIETLPKDTRRILLYGYWEGELNGQEKNRDVWLCSRLNENEEYFPIEGCDGYAAWVNKPTHWAPAPEKPEVEE
jgi:hypothetical protein